MYFLSELRGWSAQAILWEFINRKALYIHTANDAECQRMKVLMEKYQDIPMDLADASLVAVAESQKIKRIFTLDSDFYVYRLYDKDAFEVLIRSIFYQRINEPTTALKSSAKGLPKALNFHSPPSR